MDELARQPTYRCEDFRPAPRGGLLQCGYVNAVSGRSFLLVVDLGGQLVNGQG
jgi:hypothetical protein